jgi:hypothetical protein
MIELISILASIALLIVTPIQTAQVCSGKVNPKFKGPPQAYVAAFRKQVGMTAWLGAAFAAVNLLLIFITSEPGEWIVKAVAAVLWVAVSAVCFVSARKLDRLPAAAPADSA